MTILCDCLEPLLRKVAVVERKLEENYPKLFHYTGFSGLEGIIKEQTLWATNALFTNDVSELHEFKVKFNEYMMPSLNEFIDALSKKPEKQLDIQNLGGIEKIREILVDFIEHIYDFTFAGNLDHQPFVEPFIVSFCTTENEAIEKHGLLSQWRGYGQEGGYALEFDTARLIKLLEQEGKKWEGGYDLFGGKVVYSNEPAALFFDELGSEIAVIEKSFDRFLKDGDTTIFEDIYHPLIRSACRYKHWGFHEEKEIRIISIPPNGHTFQSLEKKRKSEGLLTERVVRRHFVRAGTPVPYIPLFEGITKLPDLPLPITRIIVGPHRDKELRRRAVISMLSQFQLDIPVSVSDIPYVRNY